MVEVPAWASVVVIGGGVMGCSTLYHLARNGVSDAILLERNQLTSGTTWHSAAQVRALRSTRNLTDLIRYSIELYSALEDETGQQTGWINRGSLSIATHPDRMIHIERQKALARLFGVRAETVDRDEAKERWPLMHADDVVGAVWSPDDGRVSPADLCAALAKGARTRGARIFENTAVTGILTRGGKISGVETEAGPVRCDAVAVCAGLWSRETAAMAGADVPVWPCEHFYLLTEPVAGISDHLPSLSDHDNHLYIRDESGGFLVGCFEPMGKPIAPDALGKDFAFRLLPEDWEHVAPVMSNALHRLPALEFTGAKMLLNGPESFTPDGSFLLGEATETQGLFLGCGMNSVGVATGGGAGMALAHCIEHGHTPADLHEADPKRFPPEFGSVEALTARAPEVLGRHYEITYPGRQWSRARHLRGSPLERCWEEERAQFGQFFAWERPLYFGKAEEPVLSFSRPHWHEAVKREVLTAHERAAVFDQSTFGKIDVRGADACRFLDRVCTNRMDRPAGRAIFTLMLNERGGIESDLVAIRIREDHYRLYVGTNSIRRDMAWLKRNLGEAETVTITDTTGLYAVIGLMGPGAAAIASSIGAEWLNAIRYFRSSEAEIAGHRVLAARLSYVGEAGWEITCPVDAAETIYRTIRESGGRPAGLYAQTAMRIEKRFLAYGHELDADTSPLEAGLAFAVDWNKSFTGRSALLARRGDGSRNRIYSILLDDVGAVPLGNEPVLFQGRIVGKTTSAAFGFRIDGPIALADLDDPQAREGGIAVEVDIAGTPFSGIVADGPAFDPTGSRMRT